MAVMLVCSAVVSVTQVISPAFAAKLSTSRAEQRARLIPVRYQTGGVAAPARLFLAPGSGPKPTVLLLHGFPGIELNLDLARSLQRAGWNVMAPHYRGVWGAPGQFSFANSIDDSRAALQWLRDPANRGSHGIDPSRLVVIGHSMGGFDAVMLGDDPAVAGFVIVSPWDVAGSVQEFDTPEELDLARKDYSEDLSYTNFGFEQLVAEIRSRQAEWDWNRRSGLLAGRPVLVINADDGNEPAGNAVAKAVVREGGPTPRVLNFETDHSYNDRRLELADSILDWLQANFPRSGP